MQPLMPGITKANTGLDGIVWNILGRLTCRSSSTRFVLLARDLAATTFVPPHIHPTQDEFIYMLEGRMDALIDGKEFVATAGDLIRLPMNIPHGLFNKIRPDHQVPVLGDADAQALRPVLGDPFDERAEPARRGGAVGPARSQLSAAAASVVIFPVTREDAIVP